MKLFRIIFIFLIALRLFLRCNQVRHHLSMSTRLNRSFLHNVSCTPIKGFNDHDGREKQVFTILIEASQGERQPVTNTKSLRI